MAAYSNDDDLRTYYDRVDADGPFTAKHVEAGAEIERRLRGQGYDATNIAALSDQTKLDLVPAACYYVLYLAYLPVDRDAADFWFGKFNGALGNVRIALDSDDDGTDESSNRFGGEMALG